MRRPEMPDAAKTRLQKISSSVVDIAEVDKGTEGMIGKS